MAGRPTIPALAACVALLAGAGPGLAVGDPVQAALADDDIYVSPAQLGPQAAEARSELAVVAGELDDAGTPVKLAVVPGRGSSAALGGYARDLRRAVGYEGTIVLTTPGGAVAAAGPDAPAESTAKLRRARVGRIAEPVERLISAAEVTAVRPRDAGGGRTVLTLLGLAVAGGAWAIAVGAGRRGRQARQQLAESRAAMRVHLDAMRARASALLRGGRLPEDARPRVEAALGTYAGAVAALQQAASAEEVDRLAPGVAAGIDALAAAGREAGDVWASDRDPFAGLCGADPAHGPPEGEAPLHPDAPPVPLCARCLEVAERGEAVPVRMVPVGGHPVPFTETAGLLRGRAEGFVPGPV